MAEADTDGNANRRLVRRVFEEIWNRGRVELIDDLFAESYTDHSAPPGSSGGREGYKAAVKMFREAFPDIRYELDLLLCENDEVALRLTGRGTHRGTFLGIPATGREVSFAGFTFVRVENGKIAERWGLSDMGALMQQLQSAPAPDGGAHPGGAKPDGGGVQVVRADESRSTTRVLGGYNLCKATKQDTKGTWSLFVSTFPPGEGVPVHTHLWEDEAYYILDGVWEMVSPDEDARFTVGPGDYVWVPRATSHGFTSLGPDYGRMLLVISPGGLEGFFEGIGQVITDPTDPPPPPSGPPDFERAAEVARRYNVTFVAPGEGESR